MPLEKLRSTAEWVARSGPDRKPTVLAIGNFDGMHRGHQEILRRVIDKARRTGNLAAALTFFPHPARVLRPGDAPSLLETLDQRLDQFGALSVDAVLVVKFDADFARMTAQNFAQNVLAETIRARTVFIGENFRFGHRQSGDAKMLAEFGEHLGFDVRIVQPVTIDGLVISSSAIRQALREGRVEYAAEMLGRPFSLRGEIKTGTGLGRKVVVPTLNLATDQETLPKNGVYATETVVCGRNYSSVTNVGIRPTFNGAAVSIESHLFDFNENLTAGKMDVRFLKRLRDEQKFPGPEVLREQVMRDIEQAKEFHKQLRVV
jgi:riboflavin kinase / FMN adenylyltransferase